MPDVMVQTPSVNSQANMKGLDWIGLDWIGLDWNSYFTWGGL